MYETDTSLYHKNIPSSFLMHISTAWL